MRRFLRIAFAALAVVSGLLCVAAAALWVRSHFVADVLHVVTAVTMYDARGPRSHVAVMIQRMTEPGLGFEPST